MIGNGPAGFGRGVLEKDPKGHLASTLPGALRRSSPPTFGYFPRQARWGLGATTVPARLISPRRCGELYVTSRQPYARVR